MRGPDFFQNERQRTVKQVVPILDMMLKHVYLIFCGTAIASFIFAFFAEGRRVNYSMCCLFVFNYTFFIGVIFIFYSTNFQWRFGILPFSTFWQASILIASLFSISGTTYFASKYAEVSFGWAILIIGVMVPFFSIVINIFAFIFPRLAIIFYR